MAGSQLKNLKARLKAHGLTGQTNIKKNKKNTKRQAQTYDREEKARVISKIREEFSPFEIKTNKIKRKNVATADSKIAAGKPGISKQIGEDKRVKAYEAKSSVRNKKGGLVDKRFGEKNKYLTEEEKMLQRFTLERQAQSNKKRNIFNLEEDGDDLDDMFGGGLTHLGQSLTTRDDLEDEIMLDNKRNFEDRGALGESMGPPIKKTKAEVMKEVIAKSKFYKHERQKAQEEQSLQIEDLDENFDDIMSELRESVPKNKTVIEPKSGLDREYDQKVKELITERRAAPSDRTKTEEEIENEHAEQKKKLEQQRLDRMHGIIENEEGEEKGVEDLDDGFWGDDSEEDNKDNDEIADSDDDIKFKDDDAYIEKTETRFKAPQPHIKCPATLNSLLNILEKEEFSSHPQVVRSIINATQPKLAEGNKEKLCVFSGVLLKYILFLANEDYSSNVEIMKTTQDALIAILKKLSLKYTKALAEAAREITVEIQEKFKLSGASSFQTSDIVFFSVIGSIFSTSDQYHLIITPCSTLMAEMLEQMKFDSLHKLIFGSMLVKILLRYQKLSKRFVPEILFFMEKAFGTLLLEDSLFLRVDTRKLPFPKDIKISNEDSNILKLHTLALKFDNEQELQVYKSLTLNLLESLNTAVSNVWRHLPAFAEITLKISSILNLLKIKFPDLKSVTNVQEKLQKFSKFNEHYPMIMQDHKPISIPSNAPKFEEGFNPDKKSYDVDRNRNEINKMKAQFKKERKFMMKEIRKDTKFEARQRIDTQKKEQAAYHAKMSHIYNSISTEEGAEKNKYERERKLRNAKK